MAISHKLDEKPVQLHIMHSWGGGSERWMSDFIRSDTTHTNIVLRSLGIPGISGQKLALFDNIEADSPACVWDLAIPIHATSITHQEYRRILDRIIKDFRVNTILVSSLIGHSLDVLNTNLQTVVICHDYYPFCPAINIYFNGLCSNCGIERLERCFEENTHNSFFPLASSSEWMQIRKSYVELVRHHNIKMIAATDSVRRHLTCLDEAFKNVEFIIIPHGISMTMCSEGTVTGTLQHGKLKILILGSLTFHKGIELLKEIRKDLLDIAEFYLLGCGEEGRIFDGIPGMHIIAERYSMSDLPELIGRISPDIGLLLSIVPETFSYTLSELMALRVPTLATRVGGFGDRISDGGNGFLVDPERDAVIGRIRELADQQQRLSAVVSNLKDTKHRTVDDMVSDYCEVIDRDDTRKDDKIPGELTALSHPEAERFNFHMQIYLQKTYSQIIGLHGRLSRTQIELNQTIASKDAVILERELELLHIRSSNGWKLLLKCYKLRDTVLPLGSGRRTVFKRMLNSLRFLRNGNMRKSVDSGELRRMSGSTEGVSIIIPTLNGGDAFLQCLSGIRKQKYSGKIQLIVIDSGSTDGTVEAAESAGATVKKISREEFSHSRTRNEALHLAAYDKVIFMVQDAVPVSDGLIDIMVNSLRACNAVAAYGSPVPNDDADPYARFEVENYRDYLGKDAVIQHLESGEDLKKGSYDKALRNIRLDNVCAIYITEMLRKYPFPSVPFAEDLAWAVEVMKNGHDILYNPDIVVRHSHNRSPAYRFNRAVVESIAVTQIMGRVRKDISYLDMSVYLEISNLVHGLADQILNNFGKEKRNEKENLRKIKAVTYSLVTRLYKSFGNGRRKAGVIPWLNMNAFCSREFVIMAEAHLCHVLRFISENNGGLSKDEMHKCIDQISYSILGNLLGQIYASYKLRGKEYPELEQHVEQYIGGV